MVRIFLLAFLLLVVMAQPVQAAPLTPRINEAFESVFERLPTFEEWEYWAKRVERREKSTFEALAGAMGFRKERGGTVAGISTVSPAVAKVAAATGFKIDKKFYPSPINPNFLPDGTLVRSATKAEVYYIKGGKKSWVLTSILGRWFGENHFYKSDLVITIPDADLARYPQTSSVNPLYVGKVLQHPDGKQYYIDDKLRKRELSGAVRSALKFPGGNLYKTSAAHLREFPTGPALTGSTQPGGMIIYNGPWHGGTIWRLEEGEGGKITKRLFLSDYLYEAYYYPDEAQRVAVSTTELARYVRGPNIERYPDGWVVGLNGKISVVQGQALRLIGSPSLLAAMGYPSRYVLTVFPEFLRKYPQGNPIAAFKSLVVPSATTASIPSVAPNTAFNLTKVRPEIRTLIAQINDIALPIFDRQLTVSENRFWVDFVYNGEVDNKADLIAAMRRTKATGTFPSLTSRTNPLDLEVIKNQWFPYLFYFVHQREPSEEDRTYWFARIVPGDRDTIAKLGETLQWLRDTTGQTRR
jgi:hypothetical protein